MSFEHIPHGEILKQTGIKLESMRKAMRMSKVAVAEKSGINRKTIERIEKGENLSYDSLVRLLSVYGVLYRLDDLLEAPRISPKDKYKQDHG